MGGCVPRITRYLHNTKTLKQEVSPPPSSHISYKQRIVTSRIWWNVEGRQSLTLRRKLFPQPRNPINLYQVTGRNILSS